MVASIRVQLRSSGLFCAILFSFRAQPAAHERCLRSQLFSLRNNFARGSFSALASAMLRVTRPAGKQLVNRTQLPLTV